MGMVCGPAVNEANAAWRQAEAAGVPHYGVDDVAWWLTRALRRWERAAD